MTLVFFSKILTGNPSHLNGWSCEVLSPCDRRGIYAPKKKNFTKIQKAFFLIFVECQRAGFFMYVPQLLSRIGNLKYQSISEMKICRFTWPQTNGKIQLQLKNTS